MANDFTVNNFKGSNPRIAAHLIGDGYAQKAVDCNLHSGRLSAWREPLFLREVPQGTVTSYRLGCCWLDFPSCVDVAMGPVTCKRVFITGWRDYPVALEADEDCNLTEHRLGVPCPLRAPSADVSDEASDAVEKDYEGRSYAYQYVNAFNERGALSPGSKAQNIKEGQPVVVSGWEVPDETWGVTSIRIYRTVSGYETGHEKGNEQDTFWLFVDEIPISETAYVDKKYNENLISAAEEDLVPPPPENLQGIIWIESMNTLAGFVGNRVYFSKNSEYHHWPYYLDLDDTISALCESNGIVYALTRGRAYAITGAADCDHAGCRSALRLPGNYPMVGFGNKHVVKLHAGVAYPSHDGMIFISGNSAPTVYTWQLYSPEEWQYMEPHTMVGSERGGKLFIFMGRGAFIIKAPDSQEHGWDNDYHTELSDRGVTDVIELSTGELVLLKEDELHVWNRGEALRPYLWISGQYTMPYARSMGACRLYFDGGSAYVRITVDDREVINRDFMSSRAVRLPMWAHGFRWVMELSGTADIALASIAPSTHDLGR